jgi:predicted DNA-binding transcriptional regulator YafY
LFYGQELIDLSQQLLESFETIINKELVQQILSYGKDVEVLAPENLKKELKEHADSMLKYYLK